MEVPQEHKLICPKCKQVIDMRDLSQVFAHEPCDGTKKDYRNIGQITHSGSQKKGDSIFWTKGKKAINLN